MPVNQTTIQQLIQRLTPSGANNGNPNTVYNSPSTIYSSGGGQQRVPLPPMQDAQGNWTQNTISSAANLEGLNLPSLQAPSPVIQSAQLGAWAPQAGATVQSNLPQWPTPFSNVPELMPTQPTTPGVPPPTTGPVLPPTTPVVDYQYAIDPTKSDTNGYKYWENSNDPLACVCIDQEIYGFISPEGVEVGDMMPTVNPEGFVATEHEVTYSVTKPQPCVEIITEAGVSLRCSESAPILTSGGEPCKAVDLLGKTVPYKFGNKFDFTVVTEVKAIGEQLVQHVTCGDQYFLAGSGNEKYLLHHNKRAWIDEITAPSSDPRGNPWEWGSRVNLGGDASPSVRPGAGGGSSQSQNYKPGQGIIDAFGQTDNPLDMYNMATDILSGKTSSNTQQPWQGTGQTNLPSYDNSWFTQSGLPEDGITNLDTVKVVADRLGPDGKQPVYEAPYTGFKGGVRRVVNWGDNNILGNLFDENSDTLNKGNIAWALLSAVTGLPIDDGVQRYGMYNLKNGKAGSGGPEGKAADYAQTQMRQIYDRNEYSSDPAANTKFIEGLAKSLKVTPEKALEMIGR